MRMTALLCCGCLSFTSAAWTAESGVATDAIFDSRSFWYSPIPHDAVLHASSAQYVAELQRQIKTYYGTVALNTWSYASPVFTAAADTPTVTVEEWDCQNKGYKDKGLIEQWRNVPIPAQAMPANGSDAELTIHQPATDTMWEFWRTRRTADGRWQACWGGRMQNVSHNPGIWPPYYGTTATGLPFLGGQITAEELQRGEIRHAIGIALVDVEKASILSWPANRSDGHNPAAAPNRIPEGLRFRLDPNLNVDALKLHPVTKTIARAAQKYGFVVWDKAGSVALRLQNPISYTARGEINPYPALFAGTPGYAIMNGFPWDRLQFMPKDYGRP